MYSWMHTGFSPHILTEVALAEATSDLSNTTSSALSALVVLDLAAVFYNIGQTFLLDTSYPRDSVFFFYYFSHWPLTLPFLWNILLFPLNWIVFALGLCYLSILNDNSRPNFSCSDLSWEHWACLSAVFWMDIGPKCPVTSQWTLYFFPSFPLLDFCIIYIICLS